MSENTKYIEVSFCGHLLTEKQFANIKKTPSIVLQIEQPHHVQTIQKRTLVGKYGVLGGEASHQRCLSSL